MGIQQESGLGYLINQYLSHIVDFLLPPRCVNCGSGGSLFCKKCQTDVRWLEEPVCQCCGEPIPRSGLCLRCERQPLSLDQLRAALIFTGTIPKVIHQFKYNNVFGLAEPLSQIMIQRWEKWARPVDIIVPIPLHFQRLRERGYNQSSLLAKPLAHYLNISVDENSLVRIRQTKVQATLNAEERKRNVEQTFRVQADVCGLRVLLIDDVCTTGATLNAASTALLEAGAKAVSAYCLARASSRHIRGSFVQNL